MSPDGSYLYVISRSSAQILVFTVNSDASLAASPATVSTNSNPTSLAFNASGSIAYLTRSSGSNDLEFFAVESDGTLSNSGSFNNISNLIDMVLSADGGNLYVLSSGGSVGHYTVDGNGTLTWIENTSVNFSATDLTLSYTGVELYVSLTTDSAVATLAVDSADGSLTLSGSARVFSSPNAVAAIGADLGPLTPTAGFLLAPDAVGGLQKFAVATDGMLTTLSAETGSAAFIDGEAGVDYQHELLFTAGETNSSPDAIDTLASYTLNPLTGGLSGVSFFAPPSDTGGTALTTTTTAFARTEVGGAGRVVYVLDQGNDFVDNSRVLTYAYGTDGTITSQAQNTVSLGSNQGPENLTLNPAGNALYSINSFEDIIRFYTVAASTGSLTGGLSYLPGLDGSSVGRPIDMRFHPNGRYAYVSLEDDREMVTYSVSGNGNLSKVGTNLDVPASSGDPGPIAVHPNGEYVYVGGRNTNQDISVYSVDTASNYTLTQQSRVVTSDSRNPSWLEVDPQGQFLIARYSDDETIEVFSINSSDGSLTSIQSDVAAGSDGGFLPSMTLVSPVR